jgi:hypothetical protein
MGAKGLAEFLVRDAEDCTVADPGQGEQRGFDLGRDPYWEATGRRI